MENTIENTNKWFEQYELMNPSCCDNLIQVSKMLQSYASQITPTQLEQRQSTRTAIANALDREAETRLPDRNRIVVPKRIEKEPDDLITDILTRKAFNNCIDLIRTLNPGAEVVESD